MSKLEMENATQPSFLKPIEEVMQSFLVNSSQELTLEASSEPVYKGCKEVSTVSISIDTLEQCLQQLSLSSSLDCVCEEAMLVSIQELLQDLCNSCCKCYRRKCF